MKSVNFSSFGVLTGIAIMLVMPSGAIAKDGWYFSGAGGLAITSESDVTISENTGTAEGSGDYDFDNGYALSASIGKRFGDFRLEGEVSYRENDLDSLTLTSVTVNGTTFLGSATATLDGDYSSLGFMANGIYEFRNGTDFTPFLLGGVGLSRQTLEIDSVAGVAVTFDEDSTVFSYQLGAGVAYAISDDARITGQYRYFGSADPEFDDGTDIIDGEYHSHSLMIGLSYSF